LEKTVFAILAFLAILAMISDGLQAKGGAEVCDQECSEDAFYLQNSFCHKNTKTQNPH
jgi:hypothetical protein